MASRLVYGMAHQDLLPKSLKAVHDKTRTPHVAIALVLFFATLFALSGTLLQLAGTTSLLLLIVFFSVNLSLLVTKRREPVAPSAFRVPFVVPVAGTISTLGLMAFVPRAALFSAAVAIGCGVVLAGVQAMTRR
jgi:amino acid transporter